MAKINYDNYNGKDIYNDGSVENDLLNHYKNGDQLNFDKDDVFYLTSSIRSNILNWYPFTKKDEILEIGCGCGTLTGMLCDRSKHVTCVEGSKRRADITYYRHKDSKNLDIYVGNFENINLDKKFDYIVLIGVFEYSKIFFEKEKPFDFFLEKIKSLLNPSGKVLLAIENRYGLKYWAGCNEDHLQLPYIGLEGYENTNIQTFGKDEFIDLIKKHDFVNYKFYYPFPDYKLPSIIYTDERLPKIEEVKGIPFYPYGNALNFNVWNVMEGLLYNNLFGYFSNSFLIEFGLKNSYLSNVIFAKNVEYRKDEYQILTLENDSKEFFKVPNLKSKNHLMTIKKNYEIIKRNNIPICKIKEKNHILQIENIEGTGVADIILSLAKEQKWDLVEQEIDYLINFYKSISIRKKMKNPIIDGLNDIYNEEDFILKVSLIDGNISNIIKDKDGQYVFLDQEWIEEKELPMDYLVYFSLDYLFRNERIFDYKFQKQIYNKYNITEEKKSKFLEVEKYYYDTHDCINLEVQKKIEGCKLVPNYCLKNVLYYANNNCFDEKYKIESQYVYNDNNRYEVKFHLKSFAKKFRFYPYTNPENIFYYTRILINGKELANSYNDILNFENKKILYGQYPYIEFETEDETIMIEIDLKILNNKEFLSIYNQLNLNDNSLFLDKSVVYFNTGKDFNENEKQILNYKCRYENIFEIEFDVPENTKSIRFDPFLIGRQFYTIENIKLNDEHVLFQECDIEYLNNKRTLLGKNPRFIFKNVTEHNKISLLIRKMSVSEINEYLENNLKRD